MQRDLNQDLSGNAICHMNSVILLVKNMLYSKPHRQKGFNLILFSCKVGIVERRVGPSRGNRQVPEKYFFDLISSTNQIRTPKLRPLTLRPQTPNSKPHQIESKKTLMRGWGLQGYLAHKKQPPHQGLP